MVYKKSHFYLYGKQFDIIVDHQPINYIYLSRSKLNAFISRHIKLQEHDFFVIYKKESTNTTDQLSQKCQINVDSVSAEICLYLK